MTAQTFEIEQINKLKLFFNKNWLLSLLVLLLALGSLGGYKIWSYYENKLLIEASVIYQKVLDIDQSIDEKVDEPESSKAIINLSQQIVNDYSSTAYASLAQLMITKHALAIINPELAINALKWVRDKNLVQEIYTVASIRLAKLLWSDNQHEEALVIVSDSFPKSFLAQIAELKGDIYTTKKDFVKARSSYKSAIALGSNSQYLQRKLDDLAVAQGK